MVSRACFPDLHAHSTVGNLLNQAHKLLVRGPFRGQVCWVTNVPSPAASIDTNTSPATWGGKDSSESAKTDSNRAWNMCACVHAKSLQSCPTLSDPMDCSPPGSSVHGILQARILEWIAMPFSRGSSRSRDRTCTSCDYFIVGGLFTAEPPRMPLAYSIHSGLQ